jgi:hypothetical protein
MPEINIRRKRGIVVFEPASLTAVDDDNIIWRNLDPNAEHWITKQGEAPDFWFTHAMARYTGGIADASAANFTAVGPNPIHYECSIHGERGVIAFASAEAFASAVAPAAGARKRARTSRPKKSAAKPARERAGKRRKAKKTSKSRRKPRGK